ncbi:hypothetical protein ARHIZOSPH14_33590 [Agromyces rhizosphaerae]|uniref:Phospholipase n=1 Tax=Agromyces rhizosphaerae TaxID=88374 RepID=A0A9W6FST8_9MICO|nr:hypothetical protein [Agromyces rhizosphaerae]GLI29117.1 hypothetical protein ARHIZOSPH14_33590 [Agromyces rhizosphaerae]
MQQISTSPRHRQPDSNRPTRARALRTRILAGALVAAVLGSGLAVSIDAAAREQAQADTRALTDSRGLDSTQLDAYDAIAEARVHSDARATITVAKELLADAEGKVDADELEASVASLGDYEVLEVGEVAELTRETQAHVASTEEAVEAHARKVAAERAAAAKAAALAAANTPAGARATARELAASQYGWGASQFQCLDSLWTRESEWNYRAVNTSSGATGIPQALPGSKMASAGSDWQTNATTQIRWGLGYIKSVYGTPCAAWASSEARGWY